MPIFASVRCNTIFLAMLVFILSVRVDCNILSIEAKKELDDEIFGEQVPLAVVILLA